MTFVEFQINAERFLAAQRTYLRRLAVCMPVLPPVEGVQVVLDRVDVGPSSLRHDEEAEFDNFYVERGEVVGSDRPATGFATKLAQQLTLQLTTDADIRAHPNGDPPLVSWPVTVVYDLSAFALGEECFLRAAPDSVELGPPPALPVALPPGVVDALETFVSTQLRVLAPSGTVPMGLAALKLPRGFLNAGITVDSTGQTLAIQVQLMASQDPTWAAWSNFHKGLIEDRRQGRDWAVFVPAAYLTHRIVIELWKALPEDDDLESYPSATYAVESGRAAFDISVLLIYHLIEVNALDLDVTVEAEPHVKLSLWVEQRNVLSALIDYGGLVNPKAVLSTLAVGLVDALGIPARAILYRIVGSAIVDALEGEPVDVVNTPSETTVQIDKIVAPPGIAGVATAAITDLLAQPTGIALAGSLSVQEPTNAVATMQGVREFAMQVPPVSCGAASMSLVALFGSDPGRFALLGAKAYIGNLGSAPLRLCGPPVPQRLDGPVQPQHVTSDEASVPIDIAFNIGLPSPEYYAAPFPIDVMVRTNAGTRLVRLAPPPVITEDDLARIQAGLLVKIGDCQQWVSPWFKYFRGYNPRWSPRPPEDFDVLHQWVVVVDGLPAGEAVQLQGPSGDVLASAVSTGPDVAVQVTAVIPPVLEGREIGIVRVGPALAEGVEGGPAVEEGGPAQGIEVRQTNLVVEGELPLGQPVRSIGLTTLGDRPVVMALMSDRAEALDVTAGAPAVPIAQWSGEFSGMVGVPEGTLLFGAAGVARLDRAGELTTTAIDTPVLDAAGSSAGLFLVTADHVLHTTHDLQPMDELARSDVTSVAVVGRNVLLGHAGGIDAVDENLAVRGRARLGAVRLARSGAIASLTRAPGLRRGAVVATLEDGRAALLARQGDDVVEVTELTSVPALAGAVRIGDSFVMIGESPDRLRVLRIGETAIL